MEAEDLGMSLVRQPAVSSKLMSEGGSMKQCGQSDDGVA